MAKTYDSSTDVGQVRLLIGDTDIIDAAFTDEEIQVFLDKDTYSGTADTEMAAGAALLAASTSQAYTAVLLKSLNFSKDTRGSPALLAAAGRQMREMATHRPAFGHAELSLTDANTAQIIINDILRRQ